MPQDEKREEMQPRKTGGFALKVGYAVIGVVIGLVLGVFGLLFVQNYNPKDEQSASEMLAASVVFDRIVAQNKLVTASQTYCIVEKVGNSSMIPFTDIPIPFTDNSFWYRYAGTIETCVDLETASFEQNGSVLVITLDEPFINSNTPDMERSGVLEENNNLLNPIHIEDVDAFRAQCVEASEREALEGGLLEEARNNAEKDIKGMFSAAYGDQYEVRIEWRAA